MHTIWKKGIAWLLCVCLLTTQLGLPVLAEDSGQTEAAVQSEVQQPELTPSEMTEEGTEDVSEPAAAEEPSQALEDTSAAPSDTENAEPESAQSEVQQPSELIGSEMTEEGTEADSEPEAAEEQLQTLEDTADIPSEAENEEADYEARIGDTYYSDFGVALGMAYGSTVVLLKDIDAEYTYSQTAGMQLDLNGHTISRSGIDGAVFTVGGRVRIYNGSLAGDRSGIGIQALENCQLELADVVISGFKYGVQTKTGVNFTMDGGEIRFNTVGVEIDSDGETAPTICLSGQAQITDNGFGDDACNLKTYAGDPGPDKRVPLITVSDNGNTGLNIGVTLNFPYGQIFGSPAQRDWSSQFFSDDPDYLIADKPDADGQHRLFSTPAQKVTFELFGGRFQPGREMTAYPLSVGAQLPTAEDVARDGSIFCGWYDNQAFAGEPVTAIGAEEAGEKVFYALWQDANVSRRRNGVYENFDTLEDAFDSLADGDEILVQKPQTLTDALTVPSGIRVTLTLRADITGSDRSRLFTVESGSTLIISGNEHTLWSGSSDFGGQVYVAGTLKAEALLFRGGTAGAGGAIFAANGGSVELYGCSVVDNTALQGGGLFIDDGGSVKITGFGSEDAVSFVSGNTAYNSLSDFQPWVSGKTGCGGGFYIYQSGELSLTNVCVGSKTRISEEIMLFGFDSFDRINVAQTQGGGMYTDHILPGGVSLNGEVDICGNCDGLGKSSNLIMCGAVPGAIAAGASLFGSGVAIWGGEYAMDVIVVGAVAAAIGTILYRELQPSSPVDPEHPEHYVARIIETDTLYKTLQGAFDAALPGQSVELIESAAQTAAVSKYGAIYQMNQYELAGNLTVLQGAKLTVKADKGLISGSLIVHGALTVTGKDGCISAGETSAVVVETGGVAELTGGQFKASGAPVVTVKGTAGVSGGTFTPAAGKHIFLADGTGLLNLSNVTLTAAQDGSVVTAKGTASVKIEKCCIVGASLPKDFKPATQTFAGVAAISIAEGKLTISDSIVESYNGISVNGKTAAAILNKVTANTLGGTCISVKQGTASVWNCNITVETYKEMLKGAGISVGDKRDTKCIGAVTVTDTRILNVGNTCISVGRGAVTVEGSSKLEGRVGISLGGDPEIATACELYLKSGEIVATETGISVSKQSFAQLTGGSVTAKEKAAVSTTSMGQVLIEDGVKITSQKAAVSAKPEEGPTLRVPDVKITGGELTGSPCISAVGSKVTVEGGILTGVNAAVVSFGDEDTATSSPLIITGGTFQTKLDGTCEKAVSTVSILNSSQCKITGGTFQNVFTGSVIKAQAVSEVLSIEGGTFRANQSENRVLEIAGNPASLSVTGGQFYGTLSSEKTGFISGGLFSDSPEDFRQQYAALLQAGYSPEDNTDADTKGAYPTQIQTAEASITDAEGTVYYYGMLSQALSCAAAGETVTVLKDIAAEKMLLVTTPITLTGALLSADEPVARYPVLKAKTGTLQTMLSVTMGEGSVTVDHLTIQDCDNGITVYVPSRQAAAALSVTLSDMTVNAQQRAVTVGGSRNDHQTVTVRIRDSVLTNSEEGTPLLQLVSSGKAENTRVIIEATENGRSKLTACSQNAPVNRCTGARLEITGGLVWGRLSSGAVVTGGYYTDRPMQMGAEIPKGYIQIDSTLEEMGRYGDAYLCHVCKGQYLVSTEHTPDSAAVGQLSVYDSTGQTRNAFDYGEQVFVKADGVDGYFFDGWFYLDRVFYRQLTTEHIWSFTVEGDTQLCAQYSPNADASATLTVMGTQAHPIRATYYPLGAYDTRTEVISGYADIQTAVLHNVVLEPENAQDAYVQWVDANGNLLSTARTFTYVMAANHSIGLRTEEALSHTGCLRFTAKTDKTALQTLAVQKIDEELSQLPRTAAEQLVGGIPVLPSYSGYDFKLWHIRYPAGETEVCFDCTQEQLTAEGAVTWLTQKLADYTGGDLFAEAVYTLTGGSFFVSIHTVDSSGTPLQAERRFTTAWPSGTAYVYRMPEERCSLILSGEIWNLDHWEYEDAALGRITVSASKAVTIRPVVQEDTRVHLYAVYTQAYTSERPMVETCTVRRIYTNTTPKLSVTLTYAIPDTLRISSVGYLYGTEPGLELGTAKQASSKLQTQDGTYTLNINVTGRETETIYTRPYLICLDTEGNSSVYYGQERGDSFR